MSKHNHIAVWAMIIASQVLGFIWYSPALFLNTWLSGQGKGPESMDMSNPAPFVFDILGSILLCYCISWLVNKLEINSASGGITLGLILSFGFLIKGLASHYKFLGISDSVLFIDLAMTIVVISMTSTVLAVWKKKEATLPEPQPENT